MQKLCANLFQSIIYIKTAKYHIILCEKLITSSNMKIITYLCICNTVLVKAFVMFSHSGSSLLRDVHRKIPSSGG